MTMPTPLCPNAMQVHDVRQETPDVWTISLMPAGVYRYQPGQYALVSIRNDENTLRAYTLSSSPGQSRFITLTVRAIPDGIGSSWLTQDVRVGDTLWLSNAQGEFSCVNAPSQRYLMLAGGCGITPIMSMTRWLLANKPDTYISLFYNVRSPKDVIFAKEWQVLCSEYASRLNLTLMAEQGATNGFLSGRISKDLLLELVPNITEYTVMTCGPAAYMDIVEQMSTELGIPAKNIHKEQFHTATECSLDNAPEIKLTIQRLTKEVSAPTGSSLLFALEQNNLPVVAACRAGVCGSCKTQILSGDYTTTSTATLTADEIAQGYVLACSCQLHGDVVLS